jgi:hypothetical protein
MKVMSLGRMAHFYLPASKWDSEDFLFRKKTVKTLVDEFLMGNYNGYTIRGPYLGKWRQSKAYPSIVEEVIEIKASFRGKDRIPKLQRFLAGMCKLMQEECLYLECGEDSFLIYP